MSASVDSLTPLVEKIRACTHCAKDMSHTPRPVLQAGLKARIGIFGQAPGNLAHQKQKPFVDPSGVRLREWLQVSEAQFYNSDLFLIAPMGFCFPGYDEKGGDLPPLKACAERWRDPLMAALPQLDLCILVGGYAQKWHLKEQAKKTLTQTVAAWRDYGPLFIPTPHPSWRNNAWLKKNPWFEEELLPVLRKRVRKLIGDS